MLAPDLPRTHLTRGGERELQGSLGARGERVDLVTRLSPELPEPGTHTLYIRPGPLQSLGRHVLTSNDAGEQVVGADSRCPGRPGRSFAGTHHGALSFTRERVEEASRSLILLLNKILQHLERIRLARTTYHTELPRAASTQIRRRPLPALILKDLHTSRSHSTILTDHKSRTSIDIKIRSKPITLIFYYLFTVDQVV